MRTYRKGDDETLIYGHDWSDWLDEILDTILSSSWVVPEGLVAVMEQLSSTVTTIKVSGGTIGESYTLTNIITTATTGELAERSLRIRIVENKYG